MAYSISKAVGDGSNKTFSVGFPYLNKTHVQVRVGGTLLATPADYTWLTSSTIQLTTAPASGAVVDIRRSSVPAARTVDFQDASNLTAAALNNDANQIFYVSQEALDASNNSIAVNTINVFDALGLPITNVGTPVNPGDAVNKAYYEGTYSPLLDAKVAAAAASAATASAGASVITTNQPAITTVNNNGAAIQAVAAEITGGSIYNDLGLITDPAVTATGTGAINTVATNIAAVQTVNTNIAAVQAVNTNIANVQAVASNTGNMQTVVTNITAIQNASSNASSAATSATNAASYLDSFKKQYQGARSTDPTTRYDASALVAGDLYYNTSSGLFRTYNGAAWGNPTSPTDGANLIDGSVTLAKLNSTLDLGTVP